MTITTPERQRIKLTKIDPKTSFYISLQWKRYIIFLIAELRISNLRRKFKLTLRYVLQNENLLSPLLKLRCSFKRCCAVSLFCSRSNLALFNQRHCSSSLIALGSWATNGFGCTEAKINIYLLGEEIEKALPQRVYGWWFLLFSLLWNTGNVFKYRGSGIFVSVFYI